MNNRQQVEAFSIELEKLLVYFKDEFELTYFEIVGVLEVHKLAEFQNMIELTEDDNF